MDTFRSSSVLPFPDTEHAPTQPQHTAHVPALVSATIPQTLPVRDLVGLCQTMREAVAVSAIRSSIICFTGTGDPEGVANVALEAAMAAAAQVNLRVLLVDAVANPEGNRKPLLSALQTSLHYALSTDTPVNGAFTTVRGTRLSYTCLSQQGHGEMVIAVLDAFKNLLESMRSSYDLIVINAPSVMDGALGPELTKIADGSIMVVEAEKTRVPVAHRAKKIIESAGGRVIGAVLSNRKFHIPSMLYRWL